jgi:hypothetical protein
MWIAMASETAIAEQQPVLDAPRLVFIDETAVTRKWYVDTRGSRSG